MQSLKALTNTTTLAGIDAEAMATILRSANPNYSAAEISKALFDNYPLLLPSSLISILTSSTMFPALGRTDLIPLLEATGYSQVDTLNAVTAAYPSIALGKSTLTATQANTANATVLTLQRQTMNFEDAAYWYNQSTGPEVMVQTGDHNPMGIFFIGNIRVPRTEHVTITGQFETQLFPDASSLKQQLICLMAYALQYPYPPQSQ